MSDKPAIFESQAHIERATQQLKAAEPRLQKVIEQGQPFTPQLGIPFSPFHALMRSIIYQQLSGKAAATILARLHAHVGGEERASPEAIMALPAEEIRAQGVSGAKIVALKDLAQHALQGLIPDYKTILTLPDNAVIEALTRIRGIGPWSVQMMLIFQLHRSDVWPIQDYGVKKGMMKLLELAQMPTASRMNELGKSHVPNRTLLTWYAWRALEI